MNRMLKTAIAAALLLPAISQAEDINYNFLDLGFNTTEIDSPNIDGDGIDLRGSLSVAPNWHLLADYSRINFGNGSPAGDLLVKQLGFGFGFHHSIEAGVDGVIEGLWIKSSNTRASVFGADDDGYALRGYLRGQPTSKLDMQFGVQYADYGQGSDGTTFLAEGRYFITDMFAAGLRFNYGSDSKLYAIDFRYKFK